MAPLAPTPILRRDLAPTPLQRRNLGGTQLVSTYDPTPATAAFQEQSPASSSSQAPGGYSPFVGGGNQQGSVSVSVLNWAGIVAVLAIVSALLLFRYAKIRAAGLPNTPRAFLLPKGLRVRRLGINIEPVKQTPRALALAAAMASARERGIHERAIRLQERRGRRPTNGPDIIAGGRRVHAAETEDDVDVVDEHGVAVVRDAADQLPGYEHDKLPTYGQAWAPGSRATTEHHEVALPDADAASTAAPTATTEAGLAPALVAPAAETDPEMLSPGAYERHVQGLPPDYIAPVIQAPPATFQPRRHDPTNRIA